jgi:hypothetical protein
MHFRRNSGQFDSFVGRVHGSLTFSAERKITDNTFTVEYKLTITGDKLKGKGAVKIGGEKREFDIKGMRAKDK